MKIKLVTFCSLRCVKWGMAGVLDSDNITAIHSHSGDTLHPFLKLTRSESHLCLPVAHAWQRLLNESRIYLTPFLQFKLNGAWNSEPVSPQYCWIIIFTHSTCCIKLITQFEEELRGWKLWDFLRV